MLRYQLLFIILFLFCDSSSAQNWRTVNPNDTVYFKSSVYNNDSGFIRMIWVDSVKNINGDSQYYFYPALRSSGNYNDCIDTLAASWVGHSYIRKSDGTEFYFNEFNDTIQIKTCAGIGDSWNVGRDTSGITFLATVISHDTMTIDGNIDSIKTISLQAFNGSSPVANYYYGFTIRLSKDHGWVNPLDWYGFPNSVNSIGYWGSQILPVSYERLPASFKAKDFKVIDLLWKYTPGNEWINAGDFTQPIFINTPPLMIYQDDSVLSSTLINPSSIIATLKTTIHVDKYKTNFSNGQYVIDTSYTTSSAHTDTISNSQYKPVRAHMFPEYKKYNLAVTTYYNSLDSSYSNEYNLYSFCGNRSILKDINRVKLFLGENTCWHVYPSVSGGTYSTKEYLEGFGLISSQVTYSDGSAMNTRSFRYQYLKLGNCISGTKIDVASLDVASLESAQLLVSIYPNPAHEKITVVIPASVVREKPLCYLYNIAGNLLMKQECIGVQTNIVLNGLMPGVYFLKITSERLNTIQKIMVL